jgi:tetratricopeptide (TPR) repeat protein
VKFNPKHYDSYFGRGACYDALEKYTDALKDYDIALELDSDQSDLWHAKADILCSMDNLDEALECYRTALKISPENVECRFDYGITLYESDMLAEAIKVFKEVIVQSPEWSDGYYAIAKVYAVKNDMGRLIEYLREALELDPGKREDFDSEFPDLVSSRKMKIIREALNDTF